MEPEEASLRSRLAGISMLMGGLLMAVAPLLGPSHGTDSTAQRLADLAADPTTAVVKSLMFQAVVLLLLPGVVAIMGRTRGRGSLAVVSGGTVYGAGLVGAFSFMVMSGTEAALAGTGPIDGTVAADERMASSPAALPMFVLTLLLFHLVGLPWLAFGMVRARQIPWWLAAVATVGTGCAFFGSGTLLETVGWVVLGVALMGIASTLVKPRSRTGQVDPSSNHVATTVGEEVIDRY